MRLSSYIASLLKFGKRKRRTLLTPDDVREKPVPPSVRTLQLVWFLQDVPFRDIDAEKLDDPPFADLSGETCTSFTSI